MAEQQHSIQREHVWGKSRSLRYMLADLLRLLTPQVFIEDGVAFTKLRELFSQVIEDGPKSIHTHRSDGVMQLLSSKHPRARRMFLATMKESISQRPSTPSSKAKSSRR